MILMYHGVSDYIDPGSEIGYFSVSADTFKKQMEFLYKKNYAVLPLDQIFNNSKRNQKRVFITFDDGYKNNFFNAYPVLRKYNFPATIFLAVNYINRAKTFDWINLNKKELKNEKIIKDHLSPLSWEEIEIMGKNNISFGSHSLNHLDLKILDHSDVEDEITKSKRMIENKIGKTIDFFSFPFYFPEGKKYLEFKQHMKQVLINAKYKAAVTSKIGFYHDKYDHYFLKRIPVHCYDSINSFKAKINGAFNWVSIFQISFKKLFK